MKRNIFKLSYKKKHFVVYCLSVVLLLIGVITSVSAREPIKRPSSIIPVKGTVKDSQGKPLAGATVSVAGKNVSTVTDNDGNYSIDLPNGSQKLQFTYIGYEKQEILINGQTTINVKLVPAQNNLQDVVVQVGYGTQKQGDLTGSITTVKPVDLNQGSANLNVAQMLEGRVAGLVINEHSGSPGDDPVINIRGNGSLNVATTTRPNANNPNPLYNPLIGNSNDPLVVVDGFPLAHLRDMNTINPNDIQSISVLKDASSTAIYGSRGANGVILITTKKGRVGKLNINYNAQLATDYGTKQLPLLNGTQYLNFYEQLANSPDNNLAAPVFPFLDSQIDSILQANHGGTDWQKQVLRRKSSINQSHDLTLSGRTGYISYSINGSLFEQYANVAPGKYMRYYGKSRIGYDDGKFAADVLLSYTYEDDDIRTNDYYGAITNDPSQSVHGPNGNLSVNSFPNQQFRTNPLFTPTESVNFWTQGTTYIATDLRYKLLPSLTLNANFGLTRYDYQTFNNNMAAWNNGNVDPLQNNASATYRNSGNSIAEIFADYTKVVKKNSFVILVGASEAARTYRDIYGYGSNFSSNTIGFNQLAASSTISQPATSYYTDKTESAFGRVNYSYDDRYLATVNFRADGASQFGPNNKVGYFPSAAVAWRIDKELFMKDQTSINNLKLRVGYGLAGNDNIPSGLTDLSYGYYSYAGAPALSRVGNYVPNPNLKWEQVATLDFGLDFGLKNMQLQVDYYLKKSSQLLETQTVPTETGYSQILVNEGKVQNKGIEATLGLQFQNIAGSGLTYAPQFNIAYNHNVIQNLGGNVIKFNNIYIGQNQFPYTEKREAGSQYNSFFVYHYEGVWQTSEATEAAKYGEKPGDPKLQDKNSDGVYDDNDRYYAGNAEPSLTFGLANRFIYKHFELNAFIQGVYGNKIYDQTAMVLDNPSAGYYNNLSPSVLQRWTPKNPSNTEDSKLDPLNPLLVASDKYLENGSYLRLKEVILSYNFKEHLIPFINSLRVGLGVTNIFTVTKYKGLNPDVLTIDNQYNMYPYNHTVTLNINANF